jgi:hypothetical protein
MLVFPAFLAWGWLKLRNMEFLKRMLSSYTRHGTIFFLRKEYFVLVTLSDGKN